MYKITSTGKTMVGCNHDTWLTTPKIWFEKAKGQNGYGVVFTGSRQVSANRTTPQSGMNTAGLVFSRLLSYYPKQNIRFKARRKITNEASSSIDFSKALTDTMAVCRSRNGDGTLITSIFDTKE